MKSTKILIIYDFDWSLSDKDSDHHVFEKFRVDTTHYSDEHHSWVNFVNECLFEIYQKGISPPQFSTIFNDFPISESMVRAIKFAKEKGADLYIISDGNTFFLDLAMSKHDIKDCFTKIITHKANFHENGLIELSPVFPEGTHDCKTNSVRYGTTCSIHMCKGIKVSELKTSEYGKTIYIGDGKNDFCAACKLNSDDLLLVRKGRALAKILEDDMSQISAEVQYWTDASEVLARFQKELS
ncbi:putative phosphatase phospho1 [Entomophthora muscae]|uniref:Phosphatase phospho1 n=2 Tax=Entomophthora muscae TaxID=34485 RepID=A0ACC2SKQ5_9FUNG|nr:putative phosphatase phospho1 [Entomophthora muscae]